MSALTVFQNKEQSKEKLPLTQLRRNIADMLVMDHRFVKTLPGLHYYMGPAPGTEEKKLRTYTHTKKKYISLDVLFFLLSLPPLDHPLYVYRHHIAIGKKKLCMNGEGEESFRCVWSSAFGVITVVEF
ncbi:hypothetical protein TNCT_392681 [Trichonephila clavata]|uniref:Uncharacterized protein n=1 Tax=Trichonephila clavata TaxID=2740835 RepID=A0A8X6HI80_TRICU|nr:hypothetical protein TNCT_392681 [Trichonephila clavata]